MQTILISTILFGALLVHIYADVMPDDKMKLLNDCKDQEKATDDDVQMFLSQKKPQTKGGKCLIACIYEKKGGIKDGKIDADAVKAAIAEASGGKPFADDIIKECAAVNNADRCELAIQFTDCMTKAGGRPANAPK